MTTLEPSPRTTLRRHKERGSYDVDTVHAILDEGFICHAACLVDGTVAMIPTAYGRDGDRLVLHGAAANRVLRAAAGGAELTVTVTLLDGIVLARSTFHHSFNFRSVVLFGTATEISDPVAKERALNLLVDHLVPGRSLEARTPNPSELRQTRVVTLPIEEASAKVRTGGAVDDDEDMALPVWAGVLPLRLAAGRAEADERIRPGATTPAGLAQPRRFAAFEPPLA